MLTAYTQSGHSSFLRLLLSFLTLLVFSQARRYLDVRRLQGRVFKRPPLAQSITVISTDGDNYVYVTTRTELEEQEKREKVIL